VSEHSNQLKKTSNMVWILIVLLHLSCQDSSPITVFELLNEPDRYHGRVVTVEGWSVSNFELQVLQGQGERVEDEQKKVIWIDQVEVVDAHERNLGKKESFSKRERMSPGEKELYKKLMASRPTTPGPAQLRHVVLRGEFQTARGARFGHLSAFRHRLILYRVLSVD